MKNVYLLPGFTASDLGIASTGEILWWDPNFLAVVALGKMRLAPDGVTPGPPDGVQMAVDTKPQSPWGQILTELQSQLDIATWNVAVGPYDWRLDLNTQAQQLADNIRQHSTPTAPATIVGHSAGGLVAVLAWANLLATSEQILVRRIITICTPFQGSYGTLAWLTGASGTVQQLLNLGNLSMWNSQVIATKWTLQFIDNVLLTWPSFYQLMPSLLGDEAGNDPNRKLLYTAADYPPDAPPSQAWLDAARLTFQPLIFGSTTRPPSWVMSCVYGQDLVTFNSLQSPNVPVNLQQLGTTQMGDGTVTGASARRDPGVNYGVNGTHASIPLNIALNGFLAELILDPRGPTDPTPPNEQIPGGLPVLVTDPPESDPVSGLVCIGGG